MYRWHRPTIWLFCVSGLSLQAHAADNKFDLVCYGSIKTEIVGDKPTFKPYVYHYRLDLDNNQYCISEFNESCNNINGLLSVDNRTIQLKNLSEKKRNEIIEHVEFFNRSTGVHYAHYISKYTDRTARMLAIVWEGNCDKLPFSGLPKFETKF